MLVISLKESILSYVQNLYFDIHVECALDFISLHHLFFIDDAGIKLDTGMVDFLGCSSQSTLLCLAWLVLSCWD